MPNEKRTTRLVVLGSLPGANQYINELSKNRFAGGKLKKIYTEMVAQECVVQHIPFITGPANFHIKYYVKNRKMDKDNISFSKKFLMDGLVMAHVIPNDTWHYVNSFIEEFFIDVNSPRIEVIINEV